MDLQQIQDRAEIEEVLRRYCRGVDRGDAELIRSVYHEDATDDHGSFKGRGVDFADRVIEAMQGRMLATMHNLHQTNIRFDGDTAWCETYFTAHHRRLEDDQTVLDHFGGRYIDRFERRVGKWLISDRVVVYEWSKIEAAEREYPNDAFNQGQRSKADLSYKKT